MPTTETVRQLTDAQAAARGLDTAFTWTERVYSGDTAGVSLDPLPKAGTVAANRADTAVALDSDAQRLRDIRARAIEIRDGWATMTANQRDRAVKDLADNQGDLAKTLLHVRRMLRDDFATAPEV